MSKAKKSAKQLFAGSMVSKVFTFIGSILLARILFPEDYGYLLMAMIITAFASQVGNMGFENFYLQEKIIDEEHEKKILNITFKLRVLVNSLLFIIQFFGSYLVTEYFGEEIVGELLRIFSFEYLIMAVTQVNLYILRKKLEYKPEVLANLSRDIFGTTAKVLFAYLGFGALSFAIGSLIGSFIRMIILLKYQSFIPNLKDWDKNVFSKVFFFGKHSFISGVTMYLGSYIDKIILTKFFPVNIVGLYSFSNNNAQMPSSYLVLPQTSLFLSYIANNRDNSKILIKKLLNASYLLTIIMLPVISFLIIFSYEVIELTFGEKWLDAVPFFQIFLSLYFIEAIMLPFSGILTGYGRPDILTKFNIIKLITLSIFLYIIASLSNNIIYYIYTYVLLSIVFIVLKTYLGVKLMNQKFIVVIKYKFKIILITSICFILFFTINYFGLDKLLNIMSVSFIFFLLLIIVDKNKMLDSLNIFFNNNKIYKNIEKILKRIKI